MDRIHFHKRKTIRLKEYDYSLPGGYFVTICTYNKIPFFGTIVKDEMQLSQQGMMAQQCWQEIPEHYSNVLLDEFVVMPDHVHGIIIITDKSGRGEVTSPLQGKPTTLGNIVAYYKYKSTKQMNALAKNAGAKIWQRNYYDHIIRNQKEYDAIRKYIYGNPSKWETDDNLT